MNAVEFRHVSKRFGNFTANDDISLDIVSGSVNCIVGENGAGKSTLMKMLYGMYQPDAGEIIVNDKAVKYNSPHDAIADGIGMVHQHFMLIDDFTVTENVILGNEPVKGIRLDLEFAESKLRDLVEEFDLGIDVSAKVSSLSVGQEQKTEILKVLYRESGILIFDEPTAVLSPIETESFFRMIEAFKQSGKTVIVITHKLDEVERIADKVSVLRRGKHVYESFRTIEGIDIEEISKAIIGGIGICALMDRKQLANEGKIMLSLYNVSFQREGKKYLDELKLELYENEIHGIAGVEGNGQNELAEILSGLEDDFTGDVIPKGLRASCVPDDRLKKGMISEFCIGENLALKDEKFTYLNEEILGKISKEIVEKHDIRLPDLNIKMGDLSGGNQQKAIIAREIREDNQVMIFSHPTRGVDIGATVSIHSSIVEQRNNGKSILLISSDIEELLLLSDRLSVIYKGRIVKTFGREDISYYVKDNRTGSAHRDAFLNELGKLMTGAVV